MQVFIRWNNPFNETHVFLLLSFFHSSPQSILTWASFWPSSWWCRWFASFCSSRSNWSREEARLVRSSNNLRNCFIICQSVCVTTKRVPASCWKHTQIYNAVPCFSSQHDFSGSWRRCVRRQKLCRWLIPLLCRQKALGGGLRRVRESGLAFG